MEELRKVFKFNVHKIESNDFFQPYSDDCRNNLESVISMEEEFLHKSIQKMCLCQFDCHHEYFLKCTETVWKLGGFEVIQKFKVCS